jgi:nucleoid-associated protein YgaU
MLNGLPCLGDANEVYGKAGGSGNSQNNSEPAGSPPVISIEHSLVVPKLPASELDKINIFGIFPTSIFEKVESIGRRHISSDSNKANKDVQYIVRQGDSLWSIAAEQLGKGSKYKEISKLNADVLEDENDLALGMRLSLPPL